jgi:hypothetical protein
MAGVIAKLVHKRKKRLWARFDGTEFGQFHALMAAACIHGRSIPMLWAGYPEWKLLRSQFRSPPSPDPLLLLSSPTG